MCCGARAQEMAETVGPPMPATAFRLEAVPEMNYSPSETFLLPSLLISWALCLLQF